MSKRGSIVAVDVGVNGMGWAKWLDCRDRTLRRPDLVGTFSIARDLGKKYLDLPFAERSDLVMHNYVTSAFGNTGGFPAVQVLEWPEFRAGSEVGHAAAARDSLSMLAFMCGQHCRLGTSADCDNVLVPVSKWKGTLPKEVVEKRLRRAIGDRAADGFEIESHAWDAVGIGLYWFGHGINDAAFARAKPELDIAFSAPKKRLVRRAK